MALFDFLRATGLGRVYRMGVVNLTVLARVLTPKML